MRGYRHAFHIEGRPFVVRHDRIIAMGQSPQFTPDQIDPDTGAPREGEEPSLLTIVFIDGMGNMALDESLTEALDIWDMA